jgi:Formate/nitrite transporter
VPLRKLRKNPHPEPAAAAVGGSQAQTDLDRPTADEIYEQVSRNARHELNRSAIGLFISGVAGGITMGLTALSTSIVIAKLGPSPAAGFIADLLYPIGFIAVILGRAQLFTENTLYPVALMLAERRHGWRTLRLWAIVLPSNVLGAFLFALLAVQTGALRPEFVAAMTRLGVQAAGVTTSHVFWSGVIGGWIIALVVCDADLAIDVCSGPGRLCSLHCHQRRNSSGDSRSSACCVEVLRLACPSNSGQHLRRRAAGHSARVWPGKGRRRSRLLPLEQFRNWCRPNPDFLWSFVGPPNCMRLSAKKAAHRCSQLVPRCRESGEAIGLFAVFSQGKPHSRSLSGHSNCETALELGLHDESRGSREP